MAQFQSKLTVECWKERTCYSCGRRYAYLHTRGRIGHGPTPEDADRHAVENGVEAVARQVDTSPCPNCGHVQPEMVGNLRFTWHVVVMLVTPAWLLAIAFFEDSQNIRLLATVLPVVLTIGLVAVHTFNCTIYPNCWSESQKRRALSLMRNGKARLDAGIGTTPAPERVPRTGKLYWTFVAITLMSLVFLGTGAVSREWNDWPANPRWVREVVGPGDDAWMYLPREIDCVQGYWNANAVATLEPLDQPGQFFQALATSNTSNWGQTIRVKSEERSRHPKLWVKIRVPNDPALAGRKFRVHVSLIITYPQIDPVRRDAFQEIQENVEHIDEIHLAPPHAGATYFSHWLAGLLIPLGVVIMFQLTCAWRAYQLKSSGEAQVIVQWPKLDGSDAPKRRPRGPDGGDGGSFRAGDLPHR